MFSIDKHSTEAQERVTLPDSSKVDGGFYTSNRSIDGCICEFPFS